YWVSYQDFLHSRKGRGCMERIAIAMRGGGGGGGAGHEAAARAARLTSFCLAAEPLWGPPGRGDFSVSNFHPETLVGHRRLRAERSTSAFCSIWRRTGSSMGARCSSGFGGRARRAYLKVCALLGPKQLKFEASGGRQSMTIH